MKFLQKFEKRKGINRLNYKHVELESKERTFE